MYMYQIAGYILHPDLHVLYNSAITPPPLHISPYILAQIPTYMYMWVVLFRV